jgi:uncharacterized ion transporter superfamily protein YfcC
MTTEAAQAGTPKRRRFTLPSAYTILFALIVLMAIATWIIPAGVYDLDESGNPVPGTYHEVPASPQRILIDSLTAPINGLYGIENADGNINYYNEGFLFGAIDVALFIIVIGGFLGVTLKTGAIQAGIGKLVDRLRGRERWMIPILMAVFALGGTTYGMAEESLAFYALVITVMIAAGYDTLTAAAIPLLGCGIGVIGSTINPFATGIASGFAGVPISDGFWLRLLILLICLPIGIWWVMRYAARVKEDPSRSLVYEMKADNDRSLQGVQCGHTRAAYKSAQGGAHALRVRLRGHDVRRHSLAGHGNPPADPLVVVPRDDGVILALLRPDWTRWPHGRGQADRRVRRRGEGPSRCCAHHRHRPRHHGRHDQRPDHRHRVALGRGRAR